MHTLRRPLGLEITRECRRDEDSVQAPTIGFGYRWTSIHRSGVLPKHQLDSRLRLERTRERGKLYKKHQQDDRRAHQVGAETGSPLPRFPTSFTFNGTSTTYVYKRPAGHRGIQLSLLTSLRLLSLESRRSRIYKKRNIPLKISYTYIDLFICEYFNETRRVLLVDDSYVIDGQLCRVLHPLTEPT